jgi:5,10-methenyltetrahydrofolate synthetase
MDFSDVKLWRKSQRERLIAARLALNPDSLEAWRHSIDASLERSFPGLTRGSVAFCWPIKNEYDPRHFAKMLRERGASTALPVVVAPKQPLAFREWRPGVELAIGALDIPYPKDSAEIVPDAVLLPMNGWDDRGYRLGYGAGFFDRTLAALEKKPGSKPVVIGVSYEMAHLETIHPQAWDIPVDYLVTELGVYRNDFNSSREPEGLAFLGAPEMGGAGVMASPVCYADEAFLKGKTR